MLYSSNYLDSVVRDRQEFQTTSTVVLERQKIQLQDWQPQSSQNTKFNMRLTCNKQCDETHLFRVLIGGYPTGERT